MSKGNKNQKQSKQSTGRALKAGLIYFCDVAGEHRALLDPLLNANREYKVFLVGETDEEYLNGLLSNGKAFRLEARSEHEIDIWTAANADTAWNINKTLVQSNPDEDHMWFIPGEVQYDKTDKPDLGKLWSKAFFLKTSAFFSPVIHRYAEWNAFLLKPEALDQILSKKQPTKLQELHNLAVLALDEPVEFSLLTSQRPALRKVRKSAFRTGIKTYFKWFISIALQEFRDKSADFNTRAQGLSRFLFASLLTLSLFLMPALSFDYGITWDEKLQYEYAQDIYDYLISFGEDDEIFDFKNKNGLWQPMQFYGSFFDVLTVAVVDVFDIENEYEARHFLNALFGWLGLLFAGLLARAISKNWLVAFLTFLFLILTPAYFGHSMNNPKDVPFAAGFFMAMYYMVRFVKELPNPTFATKLLLVLGIALSISIRVGGILIYPYILMFAGIKWLGVIREQGTGIAFGQLKRYFLQFAIVLLGGWALGIIFWPYALKDPISNPLEALSRLSNVNYTTSYETFEGVRTYMSQVPWYYSLKLILIGMPLVALIGVAAQLIHIPFLKNKGKAWWNGALIFMFLFPLLYAAYKESMLYNGWRHWFFPYVNLMVLAAWGWAWLIENRIKAVRLASMAVVLVGVGNMMWWMVRSHPNQYIYFNELTGGLKGAYGYYETDYYSNTIKQAVRWMLENKDMQSKRVTVSINNEPLTAQYYFNQETDSVDVFWTREYELNKKDVDYSIFTSRTMSKTTLLEGYWPPKGTIHTIEQDGVPLCAIVEREKPNYMATAYQLYESGNVVGANQMFQQAVQYNPVDEEAWRMLAMTYVNRGGEYLDSAEAAATKAIELLPENFIAYDILGMVAFNQKDFVQAEAYFQQAIDYKINYTNAHYNRGLALMNQQNYLEAAEEFQNSIRYGGHKSHFYKLYGLAMLNINRMQEGIQYLGQAAQLNPNDPEIYQYLGQAYEAQGDQKNAQVMYGKMRQLMGQ